MAGLIMIYPRISSIKKSVSYLTIPIQVQRRIHQTCGHNIWKWFVLCFIGVYDSIAVFVDLSREIFLEDTIEVFTNGVHRKV